MTGTQLYRHATVARLGLQEIGERRSVERRSVKEIGDRHATVQARNCGQARVVAEGVPHHITQRGNNCWVVFLVDEDRRFYIEALRVQSEQHGLKILGYSSAPTDSRARSRRRLTVRAPILQLCGG